MWLVLAGDSSTCVFKQMHWFIDGRDQGNLETNNYGRFHAHKALIFHNESPARVKLGDIFQCGSIIIHYNNGENDNDNDYI